MTARIPKPQTRPKLAKAKAAPVRIPTLALETLLAARVGGLVCGVDEAGRGPWAGPVSAAAVILDPAVVPVGIDDSKVLTHARREALEVEIKASAVAWAVGFASVEEIAELNILQATGLAMCRAIEGLGVKATAALVDGNYRFALPCEIQTCVGGDGLSLSIAAASILAKTARDRLMVDLDAQYPGYGFASHKGYNAPIHSAALKALGPCPAHRRGWSPIRALLEPA
ncbi:ribonuclease HII [soil metagenome]